MAWIASRLFPWLLVRAMKLGAKAWGKVDTAKHGWKSRRWMWVHIWCPMITAMRNSPNRVDDPLIAYVYANQSGCLEDGRALECIVTAQQHLAAGEAVDAAQKLYELRRMLGLAANSLTAKKR